MHCYQIACPIYRAHYSTPAAESESILRLAASRISHSISPEANYATSGPCAHFHLQTDELIRTHNGKSHYGSMGVSPRIDTSRTNPEFLQVPISPEEPYVQPHLHQIRLPRRSEISHSPKSSLPSSSYEPSANRSKNRDQEKASTHSYHIHSSLI